MTDDVHIWPRHSDPYISTLHHGHQGRFRAAVVLGICLITICSVFSEAPVPVSLLREVYEAAERAHK